MEFKITFLIFKKTSRSIIYDADFNGNTPVPLPLRSYAEHCGAKLTKIRGVPCTKSAADQVKKCEKWPKNSVNGLLRKLREFNGVV